MIVTEDQIQLQIQKQECLLELNIPIRTNRWTKKRLTAKYIDLYLFSVHEQSGTVRLSDQKQSAPI